MVKNISCRQWVIQSTLGLAVTMQIMRYTHGFAMRHGVYAFAVRRRTVSSNRIIPYNQHEHTSFLHSTHNRGIHLHLASTESITTTSDTLTMENIYFEWSLADDKLLYDNRYLSTVRLASLLGRGMHGVEARLKKLSDVDSSAYARLFAGSNSSFDTTDDEQQQSSNNGLTPVKEVLRRIQWDPSLGEPSSFTILHYDRVSDSLTETPFDAPNNSISGKETQFVFALPEHRIEQVKYRERIIWDKEMKIDCVFGSMNGKGETIDKIIESYDSWIREKKEREERNRQRQTQILTEMNAIIQEQRLSVLKDLSSQLMHSDDTDGVKDYVKRVVGLYHDAKQEKAESSSIEDGEFMDIVDFLYLFSDLVALLPDDNATLREETLNEVELVIKRSLGDDSQEATHTGGQLGELPELNEGDLEEKFVKGQGKGGQKINKTSNRVVLIHIPTQVRIECQDTRSLQQNRKIARKRLRLKVDEFINGESSRIGQKASVAVTKKKKNKSRNKRRQKKKTSTEE